VIRNRTYRMVDGVRVEGTWLHVFVKNFDYHATDLFVYADGVIQCWERTDLDGLAAMLASGKVTLRPEDGAGGSYHLTTGWRFEDVHSSIGHEAFLAEVADLIEELNDRPNSSERCRAAIDRYLEDRTPAARRALREAYLAIPEHNRRYVLGDMDSQDRPLLDLCGIGPDGREAPDADIPQWVDAYFEEGRPWSVEAREAPPRPVDDPQVPTTAVVEITAAWYADPRQAPPVQRLYNGFPHEVAVDGQVYPNLDLAYWAMCVTDAAEREAIAAARTGTAASKIVAASASRVPDWHLVRTAIMLRLLRLKVEQHPDLAEVLTATGDARIRYSDLGSPFWSSGPDPGGNWVGRLLELVRSELVLAAHTSPDPAG
jgi:predicted NAD-dependent protein-ADP-ribosyltransferase YbiA (DUF1768 family)